jgi:hypothetical protein
MMTNRVRGGGKQGLELARRLTSRPPIWPSKILANCARAGAGSPDGFR